MHQSLLAAYLLAQDTLVMLSHNSMQQSSGVSLSAVTQVSLDLSPSGWRPECRFSSEAGQVTDVDAEDGFLFVASQVLPLLSSVT